MPLQSLIGELGRNLPLFPCSLWPLAVAFSCPFCLFSLNSLRMGMSEKLAAQSAVNPGMSEAYVACWQSVHLSFSGG